MTSSSLPVTSSNNPLTSEELLDSLETYENLGEQSKPELNKKTNPYFGKYDLFVFHDCYMNFSLGIRCSNELIKSHIWLVGML